MKSFRPISISLSPNTEKDDIFLALDLVLKPEIWKRGEESKKLEEEFKKYFGVKYTISFNSGRSALIAILNALDIKKDDEILLQGFTCNSAVVPILNQKAKPIFVDVDETINIDPEDLKRKITHSINSGQASKIKAVMVQHNFGWPAEIDEILEICKKYNLFLIEDCAHSLGAVYKSKKGGVPAEARRAKAGTYGDVAFFSFGRDKIISSVFGGMVITNDEKIGERLKSFQEKLDFPPNFWIFQQLLHPILMHDLILPAYGLNQYLGRIILGFFHKLSILSKAVSKYEKEGGLPKYFPKRFPNALAILALNQFKKLEKFNQHRREFANFYERELKNTAFTLPLARPQEGRIPAFLRYPIIFNGNTDEILEEARERKIYLDDGWRKTPIVPPDTDIAKMQYNLGSCPRAEKIAKDIINLPTHINISQEEAKKIIGFLQNYGQRAKVN